MFQFLTLNDPYYYEKQEQEEKKNASHTFHSREDSNSIVQHI